MTDCIFCKITAKKIPAKIQFEDEDIIAFDDINPKAAIHILIVPKKHIESVNELTDKDTLLAGKLILTAKKIANDKGLDDGYKIVINTGRASGQLVDHIHLHLLAGQGLKNIV